MSSLKISIVFLLASILPFWSCTSSSKEESKSGAIVIGTELEYPPFSYLQGNSVVGLDIDVIVEVCERLGVEYTIKPIPHFDALIPELIMGKIDVIAAGMSPTKERAKRVLFANPHYRGKGFVAIATAEIKSISSLEDLSGYVVAVNEGYTTESVLQTVPGVTMLRLGTPADALLALQSQQVDAFLIADAAARPLLTPNLVENYCVYNVAGTADNTAFALNQKNSELLEKFNHALEEMERDGTLKQIKAKWGLE